MSGTNYDLTKGVEYAVEKMAQDFPGIPTGVESSMNFLDHILPMHPGQKMEKYTSRWRDNRIWIPQGINETTIVPVYALINGSHDNKQFFGYIDVPFITVFPVERIRSKDAVATGYASTEDWLNNTSMIYSHKMVHGDFVIRALIAQWIKTSVPIHQEKI